MKENICKNAKKINFIFVKTKRMELMIKRKPSGTFKMPSAIFQCLYYNFVYRISPIRIFNYLFPGWSVVQCTSLISFAAKAI